MVQNVFEKVTGIVGNPSNPDVAWSGEQLNDIKSIGVDTLQLSIAWSSKPTGEVLNLEDLDDPQTAEIYKDRIRKAHEYGFSALGHFGVPLTGSAGENMVCIMEPSVIENYKKRLADFFIEYNADEAMIYTYDQKAWLCSEFGECPNCKGIPLSNRLIPFFEMLTETIRQSKQGARLWWEPWELSEGQVIEIIENIKPDNFGIIMHSNIGEVNFTNIVDLPARNIARIAKSRGIPCVLEGFFGGSGEDISGLSHIPCPRLIYQQLDSMRHCVGVTGIKEYYGFVPSEFSVNIKMFSKFLRTPDIGLDNLLNEIADEYGNAGPIPEAWEYVSQGMEIFPYNANWWLRFFAERYDIQEWNHLDTTDWETPAWKSSRKAYYMVTDDENQHPWLFEDVGLRALAASRRFENAVNLLEKAKANDDMKNKDLQMQIINVQRLYRASKKFGTSILNREIK